MLFFLDRRTKDTKEFHTQRICSLCSYVLINYHFVGYADTIKLCPHVRGYLTHLNPCSTRFFTSPNDSFLDRRTKDTKEFHTQRICSLCSYVLINYPFVGYADTIKLCLYLLPNVFFLGQKDKRHKRILHTKNMFLMFLCLNKLSFCRVCGRNTIVSLPLA